MTNYNCNYNVYITSDNLLATTDPALPAPTTTKSYSEKMLITSLGSFDSHSKVSFKYPNVDSNKGGYSKFFDVVRVAHPLKIIVKHNNISLNDFENILKVRNIFQYFNLFHHAVIFVNTDKKKKSEIGSIEHQNRNQRDQLINCGVLPWSDGILLKSRNGRVGLEYKY